MAKYGDTVLDAHADFRAIYTMAKSMRKRWQLWLRPAYHHAGSGIPLGCDEHP